MTQTVNGARPVTVGADVQVCVRASENPGGTADWADPAQGSAYTRAISQETDIRPPAKPSKVRNFASTHVGDAKRAATGSWFGRERPPALFDAAGEVFPAKGEAGNPLSWSAITMAGLLRLAGLAVCYLAAFCFDGRVRATVSTTLCALAVCAHHVSGGWG